MNKPLASHRILALLQGTELLGKERGNLEALSALQNQGATIIVGVSGRVPGGGSVGEEARRRGFETHEFTMGSHFAKEWMLKDRGYRNRQLKRLVTNSRQLNALMRQWKATHLHFAAHTTFIFFALALLVNRTPMVFRCGDAPPTGSTFQMFFWKWMVRRSTRIVAISHFIKRQISSTLPTASSKTTVIHNIAPSRSGSPSLAKVKQLKQAKKPLQLVYVGQITSQKGVPELIEAVLQCNSQDLGCWVVGGSEHTEKLERDLANKVDKSNSASVIEFLGYHSDPRPFLKAADFHVAPSQYPEPMGNVVQEAKAQGTPSIITPKGGLPETLTHGKTGVILAGSGPEHIQIALADAIRGRLRFDEAAVLEESKDRFSVSTFDKCWKDLVLSNLITQS